MKMRPSPLGFLSTTGFGNQPTSTTTKYFGMSSMGNIPKVTSPPRPFLCDIVKQEIACGE
jgi:hypothetical protein